MKTALELSAKFGKPWEGPSEMAAFEREHMTLWRADEWSIKFGKDWRRPWEGGFVPITAREATSLYKPGSAPYIAPFSRIYCNRAIIEKLDLTFVALAHMNLLSEIKSFDGCFNVRKIRGKESDPDAYSIHSFGLALDFNAKEMPLWSESKWTPEFVAVWKALGWEWGGNFERRDGMHFEHTDL